MRAILSFILGFVFVGIMGTFCLFLCYLSEHKKEIWQKIINGGGKK